MTDCRIPGPIDTIVARPYWSVAVVAMSLVLSFWAVYLDPVIDADGVAHIRAAQYFSEARWEDGMAASGHPVYSITVSALSQTVGMSASHAARVLNALLHAALILGFVVLVGALGGGRTAQLLSALVILLYPFLNETRSQITADIGYWAFFAWGLAWFLNYAAGPDRGALHACVIAMFAALLFGLEALIFLLVVPAWWYVQHSGAGRFQRFSVLLAAAAIMGGYALWQESWGAGLAAQEMLRHPVGQLAASWHGFGQALEFRLDALRLDFLDEHSQKFDDAALLVTFVWLWVAALISALGLVYSGIAACALYKIRDLLSPKLCYWWFTVAFIAAALLLVKVVVGFSIRPQDAMPLALVVLPLVPLTMERVWRDRLELGSMFRWTWLAVAVLLLISGLQGLDLRTDQYHVRQAGLWLRQNANSKSTLYSNSPVVTYYSGLDGYRTESGYSWRRAMNRIQRGEWREYDYLALEIDASNPHREAIVKRYLDMKPSRVFTGPGGRVLIFEPDR